MLNTKHKSITLNLVLTPKSNIEVNNKSNIEAHNNIEFMSHDLKTICNP